jgi:hypothetical protein
VSYTVRTAPVPLLFFFLVWCGAHTQEKKAQNKKGEEAKKKAPRKTVIAQSIKEKKRKNARHDARSARVLSR